MNYGYVSANHYTYIVSYNNLSLISYLQVILEMTDGGADYCFECVGMASLVHEAFACCRKVSQFPSHCCN